MISLLSKRREKNLGLTKLGTKELKKWMGFKTFVKQYTLIKNKTIEDVVIYEKYIPYALVLGIGKDYKDTIYQIFDEVDAEKLVNDLKQQFYDNNF